MSEETKKIEKIEQDAKQEVNPTELSEQDLDNVAGGSTDMPHKDWGKIVSAVATTTNRAISASGVGR
jgi:hypothetical protein